MAPHTRPAAVTLSQEHGTLMITRLIGLTIIACGALVASANSQSYLDLPLGSWANDVTPDGTVVVGTWNFGDGFIWRWQTDPAPTIIPGGDVVGVSDDGTVVCGNAFDASVGTAVASIWTAAGGWQHLPWLPGAPCGSSYSTAYDISGDGTAVVGLGWNGCDAVGFRWTAATGTQALQSLANGTNRCSAISGDGSAMGGFAQGTSNRTPAFWDGTTAGTVIDPDQLGEVYGFNEDGSVAVGEYIFSGFTYDAFVRDQTTGVMTNLGSLSGGNWSGAATDISEDGNTVVGYDVNGLARRAWVWTAADGMISVDDRVAAMGISAEDAFVCRAVSDDGNVIVGGGFDGSGGPFGFGGFILVLGQPTWDVAGAGLAGTGGLVPALTGGGTLTAGSTATFTLTDALPNSPVYTVLGLSQLNASFKGGVMVPAVDLVVGPERSSMGGELVLRIIWPAGLPSGFQTWWQEWVQDPGAPAGFSASNALLGTTP